MGIQNDRHIEYTAGYKYQLHKDYMVRLPLSFFPKELEDKVVNTYLISLDPGGKLTIRRGYAWDGPSGPTIDTPSFMRASLVHDALYQLMRHGHLPRSCRKGADKFLRFMAVEDGMWHWRANCVYNALRWAGRGASLPSAVKRVHRAP